MIKAPGYRKIKTIYESKRISVYNAVCENTGKNCVIKIANDEYPPADIVNRFNKEFSIVEKCDAQCIVPYIELGKVEECPFIVMENIGAITINEYRKNSTLSTKEFLKLAINISKALKEIHSHGIIHKDFNANNILIVPETGTIHIIDFEIASQLGKEIIQATVPNNLEGTLRYMAPEQTGRLNRTVDFRSDFYTLGITFYEMLCNKVPFESDDLMELVHAHIAKQPKPIFHYNKGIPEALSNIIQKLLEKSADDRYQSISGLIKDLEFIYENLHSSNALSGFKIGLFDVSAVLQIPEKLYGRNNELNKLYSNLKKAEQGHNVLQIITGNPGVGKTAILNELQQKVLQQKGFFAFGTCEEKKQETPFLPLIAIFKDLLAQLLTESEQSISKNKEKLIEKLHNNGNVLTNLIPELEIFIGKQEPVEILGALESQNRLTDAFVSLIDFFCQLATPLVFIFDDMQWADKSTLKLLNSLILNDTYKHLFLIGSFRNNEIENTHQLIININEVKQSNRQIEEILLGNLNEQDIASLLSDTLKLPANKIKHLANTVFHKTAGNPFFVKEFLKQTVANKLLYFDNNKGAWHWDINKINHVNITDNVAKLIEEKLLLLPKSVLSILKDAACIGNVFDINTFSQLNNNKWEVLKSSIWKLINHGIIIPINSNFDLLSNKTITENANTSFKFLHGRMLDVVYELLSEKERTKKHFLIANHLYKTNIKPTDEKLIEITNHYNKALNALSKNDKQKVCELNLRVGKYIKDTSAYALAVHYLNIAKSLLPSSCWEINNEFTSSLYLEIGECEYLLGNGEKAEQVFTDIYERTTNHVQKLRIVNSQIAQFIHQGNFSNAINIAIHSLSNTKEQILSIDENDIKTEIEKGFNYLNHFLNKNSLSSLLENVSTNESQILTTSILSSILETSFMIGKINLTILAALRIIKYSIENGVNKSSALGFAYFGTFYNSMYSNLEKGYVFGDFAVKLGQLVKNTKSFHKVLVLHGFMCLHIKEPLQKSTQMLSEAYAKARHNGDYAFANYALSDEIIVNHLMGNKISSTLDLLEKHKPFIEKADIKLVDQLVVMYSTVLKAYNTKWVDKAEIVTIVLEKYENAVSYFKSINYWAGIGIVQILVAEFLFINKAYKQALLIIEQNTNVKEYLTGFANEIAYYFYYSLAICKNYHKLSDEAKNKNMAILSNNISEIKKYADANPSNFLHFYALANAQLLQIENKNWEAVENYELAIQNAQENNNLTIKALANELMANFYLNKSNKKVYNTYIETAFYNYQQWENLKKVQQLEIENPFLAKKKKSQEQFETDTSYESVNISHTNTRNKSFDLTTAIKFAQNISQEINLEKLLIKSMSIIIENAGASSGCLLLYTEGKFYIEAEAHTDDKNIKVLQNIEFDSLQADKNIKHHLAIDVVNFVIRTHEIIVINNAIIDARFKRSQYLQTNKVKSVLCFPIVNQGNLTSILYLENRLAENVFTTQHLQLLKHLSSQISISINNARLYEYLEHKIALRTQEVVAQKTEIEAAYIEQQKQKDELQRFAKQLEVANKTKDKFFSIIAHDLRAPFGALLNLTELLYFKYDNYDEERRKHFLKKLHESSENTFELLQNLLAWSMSQNNTIDFEPQYHSINELIEKTTSVVSQLAHEKQIELITEINQEEVAFVDENMILTVIRNLLSNAIKFTPEKGKIIVKCAKNKDNSTKISISDSGIGMTEKQIEKLFELNKTNSTLGTNKEKGTGLGLILCKDFIERNSGKLFVESKLNKGSTFSFTLPFQ